MMGKEPYENQNWLLIRDKLVLKAVQEGDIDLLRGLSALPGGFGSDTARRAAWLFLLHANASSEKSPSQDAVQDGSATREASHKDEEQVGRDTARAFVTYPTGIPRESKEALQADLYYLIVSVLRKRPRLGYFQGYHDILSVLYLTFVPPQTAGPKSRRRSRSPRRRRNEEGATSLYGTKDMPSRTSTRSPSPRPDEKASDPNRSTTQWQDLKRCAEAISLLRVRDAMGSGMEGMMGMLRLLKRILRAADPSLARFAARISPVPTLPFFALSWILCLFSHDVDSLEPVQRMFDWLLARNPVSAVYLAVAILIAKKPQMLALAQKLGDEAKEDPTLLHPLFARLPPLHADSPDPGIHDDIRNLSKLDVSNGSSKEFDDSYDKLKGCKSRNRGDSGDSINPYTPIPLSRIFGIADDLMLRFPWDGPVIQGREIMGDGSVLCTYDKEGDGQGKGEEGGDEGFYNLDKAEGLVDCKVIRTDVPDSEAEDDEPPARVRKTRGASAGGLRMPVNKVGTAIAIGVVIAGIGIALYGGRWRGATLGHYLYRLRGRGGWTVDCILQRLETRSYRLQAVWEVLSRRIRSLMYV